MSTIVLGDTADTFDTDEFEGFFAIYNTPDAYPYTAPADAVISSLEAKVKCSTSFSIEIGVYADASGVPGTRLGFGTVSHGATSSEAYEWVTATGLSIPITASENYWIAVTQPGSLEILLANSYGSSITGYETSAEPGTLPNPFGAGVTFNAGDAVGVRAYGGDAAEIEANPAGLVFQLTGLWKPGETTVPFYGQVNDPLAGEVSRLLDDTCTASVTYSMHNPIAGVVAALPYATYGMCLKVYYDGVLRFWGPVKVRDRDFTNGTVRLDAVDPTLRLVRHYLRRGDLAGDGELIAAGHDQGFVTVDHLGIRLLRDAGNVDEGVLPPLGIIDGTNDFVADPDAKIGVGRGDPLMEKILALSQALGPDFSVDPDDSGTVGVYATLNTYARQGEDRTGTVQLHYGLGRCNLEGLQEIEGEEYTNMVHVLDSESKFRVTVGNATAIVATGPYIGWEQTELDTTHVDIVEAETILYQRGVDIMRAYSKPSSAVTVTLPIDEPGSIRYGIDLDMGDTISVAGKVGEETMEEAPFRIVKWSAQLEGEGVRQSLDLIGSRVDDEFIEIVNLD